MDSYRRGILITFLSSIAYGFYPPATKLAYADGANTTFIVLITLFVRALSLVCLAIARGQQLVPPRSEIRQTLTAGFFQFLSIIGIMVSLLYLPGPVVIILLFTHTLMLLLFMAFRGEQRLTRTALLSTVFALFGISLVVDLWRGFSDLSIVGILLALGAAVATMSRLYVYGNQVKTTDPIVIGARVFTIAGVLSIFILLFNPAIPPSSMTGAFWTLISCISLSLGSIGMFLGIADLGSFRYSLMIKIEPIFTAAFSWILLGELLSPSQYLGMLLVLGSLGAYQYFEGRKH